MNLTLRRRGLPSLALLVLMLLLGLSLSLSGLAAAPNAAQAPGDSQESAVTAAEALDQIASPDGVLRFDVAEDMSRFSFAPSPVHEDGMPAHGNAFITMGYIYPAGTLSEGNGVNADGSPEFPDQVLGEWVCRGWFIGEGAHTTTGAWVITTQVFQFGDAQLDPAVLVTDGYEIADVGVPVARAITGGTGPFATVRGDGQQIFLGFNESEGVNLSIELTPQS